MPTPTTGSSRVKRGLAEMLKGGVIMDVVTPDQAKIAEDAGAVAVMALERVPADIRAQGGVSRMSDPDMIEGIIDAVTIPVMAVAYLGLDRGRIPHATVVTRTVQQIGFPSIEEAKAAKAKIVSECDAKFPGRRKPGGGYTYFDFMQNRHFDIAGPKPTPQELKRMDQEYLAFLETNPEMPADGMDRNEYLESKFGPGKRKEIEVRLSEAALESGVTFNWRR